MSDDYSTDSWLIKVFDDWFDPCPLGAITVFDGLNMEWPNKTYVNPPYNDPLPWVIKAITEKRKGKTVVMLLKHDSSTLWFRKLHEEGSRFFMLQGRMKFKTGQSAPFPSILVVV